MSSQGTIKGVMQGRLLQQKAGCQGVPKLHLLRVHPDKLASVK